MNSCKVPVWKTITQLSHKKYQNKEEFFTDIRNLVLNDNETDLNKYTKDDFLKGLKTFLSMKPMLRTLSPGFLSYLQYDEIVDALEQKSIPNKTETTLTEQGSGSVTTSLHTKWLGAMWGLNDLARDNYLRNIREELSEMLEHVNLEDSKDLGFWIQTYYKKKVLELADWINKSTGFNTDASGKWIEQNTDAIKIKELANDLFSPNDVPQKKIEQIIDLAAPYFADTSDDIKRIYGKSNVIKSRMAKANGFATFITINPFNFDSLLKDVLSIKVKFSSGKLTSAQDKYSLDLGYKIRSWNEEDKYNVAKFVPGLIQNKLMSWNIYRKQNKVWVRQQYEHPINSGQLYGVFSKIMSLGSSDWAKEIKISQKEIDLLKFKFGDLFGTRIQTDEFGAIDAIDDILTKYNIVANKTSLADIISLIPQNYQYLLPIVFTFIANNPKFEDKCKRDLAKPQKTSFDENELAVIHCIYENMFNPDNDGYNGTPKALISEGISNSAYNMYQFIAQSFLTHEYKEMYGIKEDLDTTTKIYYSKKKSNQRLNRLQAKLDGRFSPISTREYKNASVSKIKWTDKTDFDLTLVDGDFDGILISSKNKKYNIYVNKGQVIIPNYDTLTEEEAHNIINDFIPFLQEVTGLNFSYNTDLPLLDAYIARNGGSTKLALNGLANIIGQYLYAQTVAKELQQETSSSSFLSKVNDNYYTKRQRLIGNSTNFQIDVFRSVFKFIQDLSLANDIHDKVVSDVMVKGGSGEQISSVILSTLATKFPQWFAEKATENSPLEALSINKLHKQISFYRDFVDKAGNVKSATSMSVEELFMSSFLYDYYSGGSSSTLGFVLGVLSDKPNLARFECYKDTKFNIDGKSIAFKDLTADQLRRIATKELGLFYQRMKDEIQRNLDLLTQYSPKGLVFNFNTDYKEVNERMILDNLSKSDVEQDIHQAILSAQRDGVDIEINDMLFFSWDGNTLHVKPSIVAELGKANKLKSFNGNKLENSDEFFNRKEGEFVVNLLQDLQNGISFLHHNGELIKSPSIVEMLQKNPKSENPLENWRNSSRLIIAKIASKEEVIDPKTKEKTYKDVVKDLSIKSNLTDWWVYRYLNEYFNDNGLNTSLIDINQDFNIEYFLHIVNTQLPEITAYHRNKKLINQLGKVLVEYYRTNTNNLTNKQLELVRENLKRFHRQNLNSYDRTEFGENISDEELLNALVDRSIQSATERGTLIGTYAHALADSLIENNDISKLITRIKNFKGTKTAYFKSLNSKLQDILNQETHNSTNYTLVVNPELRKYNTMGYLVSEEGLNSLVGSHVNHAARYTEDLQLIGAVEAGQQVKRNVGVTSAKNQYLRKDPKGVADKAKIAVVVDYRGNISTINGVEDKKGSKPMDGATFGNYVFRKQELFSLGAQKAGIDNSKPIGNDLNSKTGTGTIIKTAVFVLTNGRIRQSERFINMHRKMNHIPWKLISEDGSIKRTTNGQLVLDYTIDYNKNKINYAPVFLFKPSTGKYYYRSNFQVLEDGITQFDEVELPSDFVMQEEILKSLLPNKVTVRTTRPINSNYELWDLFGGAYSAKVNPDTLKLEYENDNTSLDNVYIASYNCGRKLSNTVINDDDVELPVRDGKIDWVVSEGAIKQGATNVNYTPAFDQNGNKLPLNYNAAFDDPNYVLTTQDISTADIGMQLNPEHHTDESKLTLMTQVINALGLRGFSPTEAQKCYNALKTLTDLGLSDLLKGIQLDLSGVSRTEFKDAISDLILRSIANSSGGSGDLLSALVETLNSNTQVDHKYDIIRKKLPISDPTIMHKFISNFNATMTKAGIRIPVSGSMNVLVPSDGFFKLYGGKLRSIGSATRYAEGNLIENNETEADRAELEQLQQNIKPIKLHEITIGASYYVVIDGVRSETSTLIDDKFAYYKLHDLIAQAIKEGHTYELVEDVIKGRDLSSYNCTFKDIAGNSYMMWDLESTKNLTYAQNDAAFLQQCYQMPQEELATYLNINPNLLDYTDISSFKKGLIRLLRRNLQKDLNGIGSGNTYTVRVINNVNNSTVTVNEIQIVKDSLQVKPYELIASENYATTFGLRVGDNLAEIRDSPNFFLERLVNQALDVQVNRANYDIALKNVSGNNYYLIQRTKNSNHSGLQKVPLRIDWDGQIANAIDDDGNIKYQVPYHKDSQGNVIFDAEIYIDNVGNEIIYTDKVSEFLNQLSYSYIDFGTHSTTHESLLKELSKCDKRTVKNLISEINSKSTNLPVSDVINNLRIEKETNLQQLVQDIKAKKTILPKNYSSLVRQMIISSKELHTSFIESLNYIVSRTPAQSHQSFMPMVLVGFDKSGVNSAYVSRYQLYLQGSDYDVDKASMMGYRFHNGKFVTWSPFMRLYDKGLFDASKNLAFPTGKTLQVSDNLSRIYDVLEKPIQIDWNEDSVDFEIFGQKVSLVQLDEGIYSLSGLSKLQLKQLGSLGLYYLKNAVYDKLSVGDTLLTDLTDLTGFKEVDDQRFIKTEEFDTTKDFMEFINCFKSLYTKQGIFKTTPYNIIKLGVLIDALNSYGVIPNSKDNLLGYIVRDVNAHNTFLLKNQVAKEAAINYISHQTFKISSDPVNGIQAQTSVDLLTEYIKNKAKDSKLAKQADHFDAGNTMSQFRQMRLTLSGKSSTGIEASALKVYEAEYQYVCQILNYGTTEQQQRLLSENLNILGKNIPLIANAYAKNIANIKDKKIYDVLKNIDQDNDAVTWISAFLSLSTDNAKDPTLTKINADPEMIELYNAGFALGLDFDTLVSIINSETGRVLLDVQKGNIVLGRRGSGTITQAIDYLKKGPDFSYLSTPNVDILSQVLKSQGFDAKTLTSFQIKNAILPNWDTLSIYQARQFMSRLKQAVYGKEGKQITELPELATIVNNKLRSYQRQLKYIQNSIDTKKELTQNQSDKLTSELLNVQVSIEQLQDILESLRLTGDLPPNKMGGEYDSIINLKRSLEEAAHQHYDLSGESSSWNAIKNNYNSFRRFIADFEEYLNYIERITNDSKIEGIDKYYSKYSILTQLSYKAHEMSLLRPLLSLNQQLPNSQEDMLSFINKFEEIILKRRDLMGRTNSNTQEIAEFNAMNSELGIDKDMIDIHQFIWKEDYRNAAIKAYGSIKYSINVLECISTLPHYFGYLQTAEAAYKGMSEISIQFREQDKILRNILRKDLKIGSRQELVKRLKTSSRYISKILNNIFLRRQNIIIQTKKGPITLGTSEGNLLFKDWVEQEVIPDLKQRYLLNPFISELTDVNYNKTDNHNTVLVYSPQVTNMTESESDKTKFYEVLDGLNQLRYDKIQIPIVDIFFYYDMIVFDRQPSQQCLTPLFNSLMARDANETITKYKEFISDLDFSGTTVIDMDENTIREIEEYIAPVVSIYDLEHSREKYQWVKDPDSKQYSLVYKENVRRSIQDENLEYDNPEMDDYFGPDDDSSILEEIGEDDNSPRILTLRDKVNNLKQAGFSIARSGFIKNNPYISSEGSGFLENIPIAGRVTPNYLEIGGITLEFNDQNQLVNKQEILDVLKSFAAINGYTINKLEDVVIIKNNPETKKNEIDVEATQNNLNTLETPNACL